MEETVQLAGQNLKQSFVDLGKNLKIYASAQVNYQKSKLKTVGKNIVGKVQEVNNVITNKIQKGRKDILKFKENTIQKAKSMYAKIGKVKNVAIKKVKDSLGNFGQKAVNVFIKSGAMAIEGAALAVHTINGVIDFSSNKIAQYRANRVERMRQKQERNNQKEYEESIRRKESEQRKIEHQNAVESAAAFEQFFHEQAKQQRKDNILKFKNNISQKVTSIGSFMKNVGKKTLQNLNPRNIDLKIANAFTNSQIFVTSLFGNISKGINDRIDFISDQIAQYRAQLYEKNRLKEEKISAYKEEIERNKIEKDKMRKSRQNAKESAKVLKAEMRRQDFLNFKEGIIQKANGAVSKVGTMKNSFIKNIKDKKDALDAKVTNAFNNAKIKASGYIVGGVLIYNQVRNYASEQIASFREWNANRKEQAAIANAEERERLQNEHKELLEKLRIEKEKLKAEINRNMPNVQALETAKSM